MALTPYTDYQQVRAAIGVSDTDLTDDTLALPLYGTLIYESLRSVATTLPGDLQTILALDPKTPDQQRLADLGSLFATYTVALALVTSAPLFALKEMKDDRTADTRFDDPFKKLREDLTAQLNYVQAKLEEAYEVLFPGSALTGYIDIDPGADVGLAEDPVTG